MANDGISVDGVMFARRIMVFRTDGTYSESDTGSSD